MARACALAAAALFTGWAVAALAVAEGSRRLGVALLVAGLVAAVCLAVRRVWGLRARLAPAAQAAAVEAARPSLRGGLATVVDRLARPMGSAGLVVRLADDVVRRLAGVKLAEVWPVRPLWLDLRWTALALALFSTVAALGPLGPLEAIAALVQPKPAAAAATPVVTAGPHALLGDITLRYVYPAYTRLDPVELPNTNGEVRAPLGTVVQVRARTAEPWPSAMLQVTGEADVPATLVDGRRVSAEFTVAREGTWRLDFGAAASAAFRVIPDPDLAPTVATSPAPAQLTVDGAAVLDLTVKDDFGLLRTLIEITVAGQSREVPLRKLLDAPRTHGEKLVLRPVELGLTAGQNARLRIGAWDNDEVSGSKPGWSSAFTIEIVGADGDAAGNLALQLELLEALIPVLGDFLVDATPVATDGVKAREWSDVADERYATFDTVAVAVSGRHGRSFELRVVESVVRARRDLFAFVRGLPDEAIGNVDLGTLGQLHADNVEALEMAVWMLDKVARAQAYAEIVELATRLAGDARTLQAEVDALDAAATLARLDRLERQMSELTTLTARLERGSMRSFLESRKAEIDHAAAATRRDVRAGNVAAAKEGVAGVAELLEEMAGGVDEAQKRAGEGDDAFQKEVERLDRELGALTAAQKALRERTAAAREKHGQSLEDGMRAWAEVEAATADAARALDAAELDRLPTRAAQGGVDDARHDVEGLGDSVGARDTRTSLDRAEDALQSVERARRRVDAAARSGQMDSASAAAAQRALGDAQRAAARAQAGLERLASGQRQASPELSRALEELSREQAELARRGEQAAQDAEKVAQQLQADGSELVERSAEGAAQAMRAEGAMGEGDAMSAEGAQGAAEDGFREAQEALRQAGRDQAEMQRAAGQKGRGGEKEEGDGEGGSEQGEGPLAGQLEVTIPAPEEFQTPEEYRKALLEGMQGEVPEAYRGASRRYYEELVRQ